MREGALTGRAARLAALAAALLLTACSAGDDSAADTARAPEGAPSAAAKAAVSPAVVKPPINCQDEQSGGYANAKECYQATCKHGDAKACRMAESFNGNLYPTDILDKVDCGDGSGSGPKHTKSCYFAACRDGYRAACDIAASPRTLREIFGSADAAPRLEDMDYLEARKVILALGWQPLGGPCEGVSQATCTGFPEIGNCSGTGLGYCDMTFRRADRCLVVVTTGGSPDRSGPGGTSVDWVRFYKAPCAKDPNER